MVAHNNFYFYCKAEDSEVWDTTVITFTFSGLSLMLYNDEAKTVSWKIFS